LLFAAYCPLHGACCLDVVRCMLRVICCIFPVACCVSSVFCGTVSSGLLHVVSFVSSAARSSLHGVCFRLPAPVSPVACGSELSVPCPISHLVCCMCCAASRRLHAA
jgi:hypothetical protein